MGGERRATWHLAPLLGPRARHTAWVHVKQLRDDALGVTRQMTRSQSQKDIKRRSVASLKKRNLLDFARRLRPISRRFGPHCLKGSTQEKQTSDLSRSA